MTEEMLKAAAAEAQQAITDGLPAPESCEHVFSPSFQKKMGRVVRRARHPGLYWLTRSAACVALAAALMGGAWLTLNAQARTALLGWVKKNDQMYTSYHFTEPDSGEGSVREYALAWIPEGYTEWDRIEVGGSTVVCYSNEEGNLLKFSFMSSSSGGNWFIETSNCTEQSIQVGDVSGDLYLANSPDESNTLVWTSSDGEAAFCLSGFLTPEELVELAEQVVPVD